jgi:D-alanyl-D-alanine carboxypeptidase
MTMKRRLQCLLLGLHALMGSVIANGQTIDVTMRKQIDQVIERCIQADGTPSASVAIVVDDHLGYANAFGDAVLKPPVSATTATRYQLASISKTFTAQAVLLLVAAGKLSLDDSVSRWYPDLTGASGVTVRELLNHTSGYPDHYPESYPAGPRGAEASPDHIISEWGHHPLLFAPGTQFHYSNLEYEIAGRIVEKVSGESLFQFMQEHIFGPLKMTSTMNLDAIPYGSTALATGYIQNGLASLRPAPYEGPGWSFGSGQVVTTAEDVARWDAAFLQHRVLPEPQATEEITKTRLANGSTYPSALGLFVSGEGGQLRYYHTGEGLGFEAINLIYPKVHMAFVVLTNTNVKPTYLKIADQLTYLLVPPDKDEQFARKVFAGLQHGDLDRAICSEDLNRYMSDATLAEYRTSLSSLGAVQSFTAASARSMDNLESRDYDLTVGGHALKLHLLLLPDGRLEDVTVGEAATN